LQLKSWPYIREAGILKTGLGFRFCNEVLHFIAIEHFKSISQGDVDQIN
jgi:hypothetical protein